MTAILAIETSCDETSAAVVIDGRDARSNVISSQIDVHARYGGVVPEVASREHVLRIGPVVRQALDGAGMDWAGLDAIAVTAGPGLAGALLVGVNAAKGIAAALGLPLAGVNHLEGHVYANWLNADPPPFPFVCLIASGGHTDLVLMRDHGAYEMLGRTRDDASGEAFDKAARILGLGYPGGPVIQRTAEHADAPRTLPRAWMRGSHDFSFSGLKTATLHLAQDLGLYPPPAQNGDAAREDPEREAESAAHGVRRFVLASTGGALYGDAAPLPTPESEPPAPASPYGASKAAAEAWAAAMTGLAGMRCTILRYGNVYGPGQAGDGSGVVAAFARAMLGGEPPVIYGDGLQERDYVHVADVVDAHLRALGGGEGVFNLGTGTARTVREVFEAVAAATGYGGAPVHAPARPGELRRSCLDVRRAARVLGWTARVPFADGIARTVAWFGAVGGR